MLLHPGLHGQLQAQQHDRDKEGTSESYKVAVSVGSQHLVNCVSIQLVHEHKKTECHDLSTHSSATKMNTCSAPHLLGYTGIINLNLQQQQSIAPSPSIKRKSHFLLTRLLPESREDEGRSALTRRRSCSRPAERLQGFPGWDRCNTVLPQRGCRG